MRRRLRLSGTVLGLVGATLCFGAQAKDLEMLARLLIPAYLAQNFAALCVDQDVTFFDDPEEGMMFVSAFAEHVKKEITIGLPKSDAAYVRVTAADVARDTARFEMRLLAAQNSSVSVEALKQWCDRSAKHFIVEIINKHRQKHGQIDKLVEAAKR